VEIAMHFSLFHNRRKQLLSEPFPDAWLAYLDANVRLYAMLTGDDQAHLRGITRVLVDEKNWEGCGGLPMTEEIQVTIAGQAAILLLGIEHDYYANVESILVYPYDYVAVDKVAGPGMTVSEVLSQRAGESWSRGPIVLSWSSALAGGRNALDGRNVVLHEFAHKLDLRDGSVDGTPPLRRANDYTEWADVMNAEFQSLRAESARGHTTLVDQYGATNTAEFFAVVTECFFERPTDLLHRHPSLYAVLREFYGQDPATR
jgi:Mlc titration factor MtfA (ptsG expression regulator)